MDAAQIIDAQAGIIKQQSETIRAIAAQLLQYKAISEEEYNTIEVEYESIK